MGVSTMHAAACTLQLLSSAVRYCAPCQLTTRHRLGSSSTLSLHSLGCVTSTYKVLLSALTASQPDSLCRWMSQR